MTADPSPELLEARRQLAELHVENERLRSLLGLERPVAHTQSWEPTLFVSAPALPEVDDTSAPDQKVALFRSLFVGRSDVYALRWENSRTGKPGWSPAVRGGWSGGTKTHREYLPLTDEVVASHLAGESTVGLYPLLQGDDCRLLVCDFDAKSWALDARVLGRVSCRRCTCLDGTVPVGPGRACLDLLHCARLSRDGAVGGRLVVAGGHGGEGRAGARPQRA